MYFNSQPHKEADLRLLFLFLSGNYFNSQPHKEADGAKGGKGRYRSISTHSLTRRLTKLRLKFLEPLFHFNSQPHKEADVSKQEFDEVIGISTHSLTRRLTCFIPSIHNAWIFQLTASQGG